MPPYRTPERTPEYAADFNVEQLVETASTLAYEATPVNPIDGAAIVSLAEHDRAAPEVERSPEPLDIGEIGSRLMELRKQKAA